MITPQELIKEYITSLGYITKSYGGGSTYDLYIPILTDAHRDPTTTIRLRIGFHIRHNNPPTITLWPRPSNGNIPTHIDPPTYIDLNDPEWPNTITNWLKKNYRINP